MVKIAWKLEILVYCLLLSMRKYMKSRGLWRLDVNLST
jgi:hypothetical protein